MPTDELIKVGKYYLGPIKSWETWWNGYAMRSGVGDFITNQMKELLKRGDKSPEAISVLKDCVILLKVGSRWPWIYQKVIPTDRQCKNRMDSWYNKMKFKVLKRTFIPDWVKNHDSRFSRWVYKIIRRKTRAWTDMTRDPYIAVVGYAVEVGRYDLVEEITIPRYLWRGTTWKWMDYLNDPTDENRARWILAEKRAAIFKTKGFVNELITIRLNAANKRRADLITEEINNM